MVIWHLKFLANYDCFYIMIFSVSLVVGTEKILKYVPTLHGAYDDYLFMTIYQNAVRPIMVKALLGIGYLSRR